MAVVTVRVSFNLQIRGDTQEDGNDEKDRTNDEGVEHDSVVIVEDLVGLVNDDTDDAVTDGTPQTLTTEHFFAEFGIGGELAHHHGVQEGEGTGGEEETGSIDGQVVRKLQKALFRLQKDREEQQTHASGVRGNTGSNNQTILSSTISKTGEDKGTGNIGELDKIGQGVFVLGDTPVSFDVLEEEGVGGVNHHIQSKVKHLRDNQPFLHETRNGTT